MLKKKLGSNSGHNITRLSKPKPQCNNVTRFPPRDQDL